MPDRKPSQRRSRASDSSRTLALLIAGAVAARQITGLLQLRSTLAWLAHAERARPGHDHAGQGHAAAVESGAATPAMTGGAASADALAVHVVVPVLHEQDHVGDMIAWFAGLLAHQRAFTLTVVTSERETLERDTARQHGGPSHRGAPLDRPTTCDVVAAELPRYAHLEGRVRHLHYAGNGRKAAQVNHAVAHLTSDSSHDRTAPGADLGAERGADLGRDADASYVAVYDVDSRPTIALLRDTVGFVRRRRERDGEWPAVVQQSARFTTTGCHPGRWQQFVCRGAARLQTLWTLRRELPSFRRYSGARGGGRWSAPLRRGLAQTVGHGLLVRADVYWKVGGLPTRTVLDDLPFGYHLTVAGVDVAPLPGLSEAPAPEGVTELLAQGRRWFQNYLDYPLCAREARARGAGTRWTRGVALGLGCYRGLTWLLRSPGTAITVALLLNPRSSIGARLMSATALAAGVAAPAALLARAEGRPVSVRATGVESLELLVANLISSAGPMAAVVERALDGQPGHRISPTARDRRPDPVAGRTPG